ncbi:uncharacterized protein F4807DRAFT_91149 [Annulohypoxylon truncatum]|uniref:uncharacterized protein n=1 Tax=Annulohypoxylon truncatum TaxID=327061 RepID=UPI0020072AB2|nr:uncharacterized protein F4807DRAFT_91149 [Annulohypoxylon truncatum]KAI1209344.1 hypothetical protein F4807DRAFT_91149 [Annulohypoxylon truncatum]
MAENNTNGIEKVANGDATIAESQPSIPPAAKEPVDAGDDSTKPSIATEPATKTATDATTGTATVAPSSEPAAQTDAAGTPTLPKEELTEKVGEAEKLASQPENPADSAPTQTTTDTTTAGASSLTNGETKELPKPVTAEEIRDQDLPDAAPTEMTGALPVDEPAENAPKVDDAPKADTVPAVSEAEKSEISTGDKRKLSEASNDGDDAAEKPVEDAPVEKKQKTNGATTNGPPKKVGRPKKDKKEKKAAPSVGRTARKTRSQGAAD